MARRKGSSDTRLNVARYQVDKLTPDSEKPSDDDEKDIAGQRSMDARTQYVEITIQQAIRRGDFDDLPLSLIHISEFVPRMAEEAAEVIRGLASKMLVSA